MRLLNPTIFILTFLGILSCHSMKNVTGTYRSNFSDMGFFVTKVKLKGDSTFEYRFRGDMLFDTATGKYHIDGQKLILSYDPKPVDTLGLAYARSIGFKLDRPLTLKNDAGLPHVFYFRQNKLFGSYQDGKIVRKALGYSKRKKYFVFGSHYYKRKHFLDRVD